MIDLLKYQYFFLSKIVYSNFSGTAFLRLKILWFLSILIDLKFVFIDLTRSSDLRRIDFHWLTSHVIPGLSPPWFCVRVCACVWVCASITYFSWAGKITGKRQPVVSWRKDWRRHGSQTWWFPRFHQSQRVFLVGDGSATWWETVTSDNSISWLRVRERAVSCLRGAYSGTFLFF